jgi:hypothetical protein
MFQENKEFGNHIPERMMGSVVRKGVYNYTYRKMRCVSNKAIHVNKVNYVGII